MISEYLNYSTHYGDGWWGRRGFVHGWWSIYAGDSRWVPPHYPTLRRLVSPGESEHLDRQKPILFHMEAMPGRSGEGGRNYSTAIMETPVGAAVLLMDPRRRDRTAYLGMLHCVNDEESVERLLGAAMEQLWPMGYQRLIGPTGLSPHLQSGILMDHYHLTPPLHTPYNPPYIPEIVSTVMTPLGHSRLFHFTVPSTLPERTNTQIQLSPVEPERFTQDLLPLLAGAFAAEDIFPVPDEVEAQFLVRWLQAWPLHGWVAQVEGRPVGYILLQPDLSASIVRARGGRNPLLRWWLAWRSQCQVRDGRIVFGGVLPEWRRCGIGGHLWSLALRVSRQMGWHSLTVGPISAESPAAAFLTAQGAEPQQNYVLYASEL